MRDTHLQVTHDQDTEVLSNGNSPSSTRDATDFVHDSHLEQKIFSGDAAIADLFLVVGIKNKAIQQFHNTLREEITKEYLKEGSSRSYTRVHSLNDFVAYNYQNKLFDLEILHFTPLKYFGKYDEIKLILSAIKTFFPHNRAKILFKTPKEKWEESQIQRKKFFVSALGGPPRQYLNILQVNEFYALSLQEKSFLRIKPWQIFDKSGWDSKFLVATPKFLCLLSSFPLFNTFRRYLLSFCNSLSAASLYGKNDSQRFGLLYKHFLSCLLFQLPRQPSNANICFPLGRRTVCFPTEIYSRSLFQKCDFTFLPFFSRMSSRNILRILQAVLHEKKLLFFCEEVELLTLSLQTILILILPFEWVHTFIPVLPEHKVSILGSVTPFLCGFVGEVFTILNRRNDISDDCVIIDLNSDNLYRKGDFVKHAETSVLALDGLELSSQNETFLNLCTQIAKTSVQSRQGSSIFTGSGSLSCRHATALLNFSSMQPEFQVAVLSRITILAILIQTLGFYSHFLSYKSEAEIRHGGAEVKLKKLTSGLFNSVAAIKYSSRRHYPLQHFLKKFFITNCWENFIEQHRENNIFSASMEFFTLCCQKFTEKALLNHLYFRFRDKLNEKYGTIICSLPRHFTSEFIPDIIKQFKNKIILPHLPIPGHPIRFLNVEVLNLPRNLEVSLPDKHLDEDEFLFDTFLKMCNCLMRNLGSDTMFYALFGALAYASFATWDVRCKPSTQVKHVAQHPLPKHYGSEYEASHCRNDNTCSSRCLMHERKASNTAYSSRCSTSNTTEEKNTFDAASTQMPKSLNFAQLSYPQKIAYDAPHKFSNSSRFYFRFFATFPKEITIEKKCWCCGSNATLWHFLAYFTHPNLSRLTCFFCKRYMDNDFKAKINHIEKVTSDAKPEEVKLLTLPQCYRELNKYRKKLTSRTGRNVCFADLHDVYWTIKIFFSVQALVWQEGIDKHRQVGVREMCLDYLLQCKCNKGFLKSGQKNLKCSFQQE